MAREGGNNADKEAQLVMKKFGESHVCMWLADEVEDQLTPRPTFDASFRFLNDTYKP